jgi:hypothetical protein
MNERGAIGVIVAVVIVVLLVGGAGAWYYMQTRGGFSLTPAPTAMTSPEGSLPTALPTTPVQQGQSLTGKISDLVQSGQSLTCTFQRADQGVTTSGTVYVAGEGERLRGDFNIQQTGSAAMNGHMVRTGQDIYVWSDQLPQGTKFTVTDESSPAPAAGDSQQQILDQNFTYACQPWTVDEALFTLPGNVQFVDVSAQLQQLQPGISLPPLP